MFTKHLIFKITGTTFVIIHLIVHFFFKFNCLQKQNIIQVVEDRKPSLMIVQIDNRGWDDTPKNKYQKEQEMMTRQKKFHFTTGFWVQNSVVMHRYADYHGHAYLRVQPISQTDNHYSPNWDKIVVMRELLDMFPTIEYFWYLDGDAVIEQFDLDVLDFLKRNNIKMKSFIAGFYTKTGAGTGEWMVKNDAHARSLLEQWRNSIRNGRCKQKYMHQPNFEQNCLEAIFKHNKTNIEISSQPPIDIFTKRFIKHCGGASKDNCERRQFYNNIARRLEIDTGELFDGWKDITNNYLFRPVIKV